MSKPFKVPTDAGIVRGEGGRFQSVKQKPKEIIQPAKQQRAPEPIEVEPPRAKDPVYPRGGAEVPTPTKPFRI